MKKLFRIAAGIMLAGVVVITTTGCYVVYDHRGGPPRGYDYRYGYGYAGHHHDRCSPYGW